MRLTSLALLFLAACDDPDCGLESQLDTYVDSALLDCGQLVTRSADRQPYLDARACVLAATAEQTPFVVRWTVFGIDSGSENALFGQHEGGWRVRRIQSTWSVKGEDVTEGATTRECRSVGGAAGDCETLFLDLCLACANSTHVATCD